MNEEINPKPNHGRIYSFHKSSKRNRMTATRREDLIAVAIFLAPNLLGFLIFIGIPTIASLIISLYDWSLVGEPSFVGLTNFRRLFFEDRLFPTVLNNTFQYVGLYVLSNVVFAMIMALWLTSWEKWSAFFRSVFFMPVIFPVIAVALVWQLLYQPSFGLINSILRIFGSGDIRWLADANYSMFAIVIMSIWLGFGYNLVIFIAAIRSIPDTYIEAAKIDGAGSWTLFWHIKLPSISPAVFFCVVMTVITSFQVFDQTYVLTGGGPVNSTNTLVLYLYQQGFQFFSMGYASAIAWVLFAFIFVFTIVQSLAQKRWVHYE